jgi:hypothetical protein
MPDKKGRFKNAIRRISEAVRGATRSKRWRFALSFGFSLFVLLLVVFMITSGFAQVIASIASIGGIQAEIGEIRGDDVAIYPAVGESSNCPWTTPGTSSGPQEDPPGSGDPRYQNPVSSQDQALPMLRADISNAEIPAGYGVSFKKDVELPGPFGADAFRIEISRNETLVPGTASLFEKSIDEDFEAGGSVPSGWSTSGDADVNTNAQNSGRYSEQVSMGSTGNEFLSPAVDTDPQPGTSDDADEVEVEFWVKRGSDSISNLPESGEDLVVEYLDVNGNWLNTSSSPIQASNFLPEEERVITDRIDDPDARHAGFQVRFRGDGDGTDGFDYWHIDDVAVKPTRYGTPRATSASDQFFTSVSLDTTNATVGASIVPIQESTAFDRTGGRRDLTQARMYLVKGTQYQLDATMDTVATEFGAGLGNDYNQQTSAAKAWIDWDNDTDLGSGNGEFPADDYNLGSGDGGSDGVEAVSTTFTVPSGADTGPTLMRVKMEANEGDPSNLAPDTDVTRGMVEDYTVVVVDSLSDIPEPVSIGDASLKTSGLKAEYIDLRGGASDSQFILEDRYSNATSGNTPNPVFAADPPPQGEFSLRAEGPGQNAKIRDASAVLHQLAFNTLDISLIELDLSYISDEEAEIATQQCPILEPQFLPRITNAPVNVSTSTSFDVDYNIRNPGLESETQDIEIRFPNSTVENTRTETISATTTRSFIDTVTAPSTTGRYDVVIDPQGEPRSKSARQEVIVGDVPNFGVIIDGISPDPVVAEDQTLEVQTTVTNTGDVVDTQDITLSVGGQRKEINEKTLNGGSSQTFNFSYTPTDSDSGSSVPVNVSSDDDFDLGSVDILESPEFFVNITRSNAPVDAGNELEIEANITNTGGFQDTQDVRLDITNSQSRQEDVDNVTGLTLSPGQTEFRNFTYSTSNIGDPPSVDGTVRSDDDQSSGTFVVEGQGVVFQVIDTTPNVTTADPEDIIEFDTLVKNVGSSNGSQDVELNITPSDPTVNRKPDVDNATLTLNQTETQNVSLFYTVADEDAPKIEGEALSRNQTTGQKVDSDTANVSVNEPAFFQPTVVDAEASLSSDTPIEGRDDVQVNVEVQNTGGLTGDGTVVLEVDTNQDGTYDTVADVQAIEGLVSSGTESVSLNYSTASGDADAVNVRARGYTTRREAENFDEGGSQPTGWTFENNASVSSYTSNSGSYSAFTCCNADSNVTSPGVDTTKYSDSGVIALDYWIQKGDDSFSEDPDGSEDLEVQYLNDNSNWITIETLQTSNFATGEVIPRIDQTITAADAFHTNFQLRFRQTSGDGTGGAGAVNENDVWHIDDVAIKSGDVDGSDTGTSTVLTPPFYQVTVTSTANTNIEIGTGGVEATPTVFADITNTGTAAGSQQTIELTGIGDATPEDTVVINGLSAGETTSVQLEWNPNTCSGAQDCTPVSNDGTPTVSSANDSDTGAAVTATRPSFEVTNKNSRDDGSANSFGNNGIVNAASEDHLLDFDIVNNGVVADSRRVTWDVGTGSDYSFQNDVVGGTSTDVAPGSSYSFGTWSFTPSCSEANTNANPVGVDYDLDFQSNDGSVQFNPPGDDGTQDYNTADGFGNPC